MTTEKVKLTIDGKEIEARQGQMVIEAARDAGIYIPYLCWHPILKPFGACRMCVVQASNAPGLPASCHTAVADGQEVITNSPQIEEVRREILALTLSEHPHGCLTCWRVEHCGPSDICLRNVSVTDRCVVCPQNERCELQDVTYAIKLDEVPLPYKYRGIPLETRNPFIDHDMNLCIVCGKCVRACDELEGAKAITFEHRGDDTVIASALGGTLADSGCTFCGLCVDVCPVGAITEKDSKWAGAADDMVTTTCSHCSIGCTLNLNVKNGKLIRATFDTDGATNHGHECARGKFGHKFVSSNDRLAQPWMREGTKWERTSWDIALDSVAKRLDKYKPEEIFLLASPKNTNEDNYVLQKLGRTVLGTNNIDFVDSLCPPGSADGLLDAFGSSAATNSVWDLRNAKTIVVVDSDLTFEHPVAAMQVKEAVNRGAHLIVVDPRDTELDLLASEKLTCKPGTEIAVLAGIMRILLDEGLYDAEFVEQRCVQIEDLQASLGPFSLDVVEQDTGVLGAKLAQVAQLLTIQRPSAFLFGAGLYPRSSDLSVAVADLAMLTGSVGKMGAGVFPLVGENNSQGASDMGCRPAALPGGIGIGSAAGRLPFREAWGDKIAANPGIGYQEMIKAAKAGKVKALIAIGENQLLADPTGELALALEEIDFVVIHETFAGAIANKAHVLLPATTFAEREGTYTNLERRVQRVRAAVGVLGEARPAWDVLSELGRRMGSDGFGYEGPADIMVEIAKVIAHYAGINYERLDMNGIQWPCPDGNHPGTKMLHEGQFSRGLGRFLPVVWSRGEAHDGLKAITNVAREVQGILELAGTNVVEINSSDALNLGVSDGEMVTLSSNMGTISAKARVNGRAEVGTVLVTMPHTNMLLDMLNKGTPGPMALFAQVKSYPVKVGKV